LNVSTNIIFYSLLNFKLMKYFSLFFLFISLLFLGCKEEKDQILPTISVIEPNDNSIYNVLDFVRVRASISDNENLEEVFVQLEDLGSGRRVGKTIAFTPNSSSFELDVLYEITDTLLNSGDYYFRIQAYDGENINSAFASIRLIGIPRKQLGYYLLLDRTNDKAIYEVNDNNQSAFLFSAGQSEEIAFNSRAQMLWYADKGSEKIGAYQVKKNQDFPPRYPNGNTVADPILDMQFVNGLTYVSTQSGFVQAFNGNFSDVFTYKSSGNFKVDEIYPIANRIMLRETDGLGQNQRFLYLFSNGAIDSQSPSSEDVVGFGSRTSQSNSAFQFISQGSDMEVREYDLNSGLSSFLLQKPNFNFHSLIQIREYEYLFYNDSRVVIYNLSTNFTRTLANGLGSAVVAFDEVNEEVYVADGNNIILFDYNSGSQTGSFSAAFPVEDIVMRYNK